MVSEDAIPSSLKDPNQNGEKSLKDPNQNSGRLRVHYDVQGLFFFSVVFHFDK